jgi:hypothetical protein
MDIQQRPNNATYNINNHQRQCKSTPPITLTNSTTIASSSIHVHTFNKITIQVRVITILSTIFNINCNIHINPQQLHNIVQQFHTLSHKPSKVENTTPYDKHHFQHLTTMKMTLTTTLNNNHNS